MEKYLKNVYNVYKNYSRKDDFYLGPRLTPMDNENPKYLILGINPSNSYGPHAEFSKEICDDLREISVLNDQEERQRRFNDFLSFKNYEQNREYVCKLQELAHIHHNHFEKHKDFAEKLGLSKEHYAFFDLFPLWEIEQEALLDKLEGHPKLEKELLDEFFEFIDRNKSIEELLFFNAGAYKKFSNYLEPYIFQKQEKKHRIPMKHQKKNVNWNVFESSVLLKGGQKIKVWGYGLGGVRYLKERDKETTALASRFKHKFAYNGLE